MNASEYDKMYELEDTYWWFVARRRLAIGLLRRDSPLDRAVVLDVGCGTGVVSREIAQFAQPVSLDFSELALKYCGQRGLLNGVRGDGARLPIRSEVVRSVIGLDIFEHIEDDIAAFREAYRVLEPGGELVLSVPAFTYLWGPHDIALHHFRRYRKQEVAEKLAGVGFEVRQCSYSVFLLFPIVLITRGFEKLRPGPPKASLPGVPAWANRMLVALQDLEARWIVQSRWSLPWGSSVIAVARKPRP